MSDFCVVDGRKLSLNGSGFRKLFMMNVYKASLFTERRVCSDAELRALDGPVRLSFEYLYGPISHTRMTSAWSDALANVAKQGLEPARGQFLATITDYQRGDIVDYDLLPSGQLRAFRNGELQATISSGALCRAVLDVIFGSEPIDKGLKQGLLASDPAAQEAAR